jgi:6-phosphogluconolactonase/glucosamine-6-phosphate isomerase/deaminase
MANGNKKAAIMRSALNKPATKKIPATIAQTIRQGYIMLDTEAASLL